MECWSIARELYASENPNDLCLKLQKIGVGFCFSNTPLFQHSISMLTRAESWRAPFQGANQSQVFWAWILYLYVTLISACPPSPFCKQRAGRILALFQIAESIRYDQGKVASKGTTLVTPSALKTAAPSDAVTGNEASGAPVHHFSRTAQGDTFFSFSFIAPGKSRVNSV